MQDADVYVSVRRVPIDDPEFECDLEVDMTVVLWPEITFLGFSLGDPTMP